MSSVGAGLVGHLVRRGVQHYSVVVNGVPMENDGVNMDWTTSTPPSFTAAQDETAPVPTGALIGIAAVLFVAVLLSLSIDYTVNGVIYTLALIESPSATAIVDAKPPPYTDEPDAPLDKAPLLSEEDVEVTIVQHKPITSSVVASIKHLHSVGGFFSRWRGLAKFFVYHLCVNTFANITAALFRGGDEYRPMAYPEHFFGNILFTVLAHIIFARIHALWTQSMVAKQEGSAWRFVARKESKVLMLAALIESCASYGLGAVTLGVAMIPPYPSFAPFAGQGDVWSPLEIAGIVIRIIVTFTIFMTVLVFVNFPVWAARARIEACLLADDRQTIVPFDRESIMADIDLSQRGSPIKLWRSAYASFSTADRWRVLKLSVKGFMFQLAVALVAFHLVLAIVYVTGPAAFIAAIQQELRIF